MHAMNSGSIVIVTRKCWKVLHFPSQVVTKLQGSKRGSSSLLAQRRQRSQQYTTTQSNGQCSVAAPSFVLQQSCTTSSVDLPSAQALQALFVASAVPMIGFGFMDNLVMIQAGQYIDSTLGVQLGLATMTAAAAGQVVSDVSGVIFGSSLERVLSPYIPECRLTKVQLALPVSRRIRMAGAVCGVIVGCGLGAMTLWTVDLESRDRQEKLERMRNIVGDLQRVHPQMRVHWAHQDTFKIDAVLRQSSANRELLLATRGERCSVCVPILADHEVVGVVEYFAQAINEDPSPSDIEKARMMASHLGIVHNRLD